LWSKGEEALAKIARIAKTAKIEERILRSHAIAAEDRPTLEHLLITVLPPGIVGLERQPWINHHG
jgi:hypothetical protein